MQTNKHVHVTYSDYKAMLHEIIRQMAVDGWHPDIVCGPLRGGLAPAVYISHFYQITMVPLTDLHIPHEFTNASILDDLFKNRHVLMIDDICDSGKTFDYLSKIIGTTPYNTCKFAALHFNLGQDLFTLDYWGDEINKLEDPRWVIYPWEEWWKNV